MAASALTYIVVAGNSGAGKSTLVKALAAALRESGAAPRVCDEREFHHPHLQNMFADPRRWALPIQLNFMTQRAARLLAEAAADPPAQPLLMERCLWEDRLFFEYYVGRGAIDSGLRPAYGRLLGALIAATPRPSVVVHLRAEADWLYQRLERAYATGERPVELRGPDLRAYIGGMNELYEEWPGASRDWTDRYLELRVDRPGFDAGEIVSEVRSRWPVAAS
jgi:deoxyadenosine/deoxycytidine kinase